MPSIDLINSVAKRENIQPVDVVIKYLLTQKCRKYIAQQLSKEDDEEYDETVVDQLCESPRSRQKLMNYFVSL